jgi:predicted DsbA family dithiol-disulfide isomerase
MRPMTIEIFSDITCPWCFIGTRRLADAVARVDAGADVTVVHRPFLLNPDAPSEGLNLAAHLQEKYQRDPRDLFRMVETAAERSGLVLDLSVQSMTYPTVAAHTLLRHARPKDTERLLLDALFEAYFLAGRNIADHGVLAEIASAHGFTLDEARRLLEDEAELGVTRSLADQTLALGISSVPHFVFGDSLSFSGAQAPEVFEAALRKTFAA